jgi:hypothetical protein
MTTHIFVEDNDFPQKDVIMNSLKVSASVFDGKHIPNLARVGFLWVNERKTMPFGTKYDAEKNVFYFTKEVVAFLDQYQNIKVDLITCNVSKVQMQSDLLNLNAGVQCSQNFYKTIEINYSVNLTGNPQDGGDWIMESNGENIRDLYFNSNILNYTGTLDLPLNVNIPNLAVYYKFEQSDVNGLKIADYASGSPVYDAYLLGLNNSELPWTANVSGVLSGNTTVALTDLVDVAVSGQRIVVCDYSRYVVLHSAFSGASWSTFRQIAELSNNSFRINSVELTDNGNRCIVAKGGDRVYISTWDVSNSNFSTLTATGETTARNYTNLSVTQDGNRLAVTDCSYVYFATWDGSNYGAFTQTSETTRRRYSGVGISADGSKLVYSELSGNVYVASWNGFNYGAGVQTLGSTHSFRDIKFSPVDSNIIYAVEGGNSNGTLWVSVWNGSNYDDFSAFSTSILPNQTNAYGLSVSTDNNIYLATPFGTTSLYKLRVSGSTLPLPPTNLSFSKYNSLNFTLTFTTPVNSNNLYYTATATPVLGGTPVVRQFANINTYLLDGLTPDTLYDVALTVTTPIGTSVPVVMQARTKPSPTIPNAPTSLSLSAITTTSMTLSFTAPAQLVYTYNISATPSGGSPITSVVDNSGSSYVISGLSSNTVYDISLSATNEDGTSSVVGVSGRTKPDAPTALSASNITSTGARINFTPPSGTVTSYTLTAVPNSGSTVTVTGITSSPAVLTGFTTNTTYQITMVAIADTQTSASSSTLALTLGQGPPSGLTATTILQTTVTFTFTPPAGTITSYTVSAVPASGSTVTGTFSSVPYTLTGLAENTQYTFRVTASSAVGTSTPSLPLSVKTLAYWTTGLMHRNGRINGLIDSVDNTPSAWRPLSPLKDASGNIFVCQMTNIGMGLRVLFAPDYQAHKNIIHKRYTGWDGIPNIGAYDPVNNVMYARSRYNFNYFTNPGNEETECQSVSYFSFSNTIQQNLVFNEDGRECVMTCDKQGNIYAVGIYSSFLIMKFTPYFASGQVFCGGGGGSSYNNVSPTSINIPGNNSWRPRSMYVTENNDLYILFSWGVWKISASTGLLTTVTGVGGGIDFAVKDDGSVIWVYNGYSQLVRYNVTAGTSQAVNISVDTGKYASAYSGMWADFTRNRVYTARGVNDSATGGNTYGTLEVSQTIEGGFTVAEAVTNLTVTGYTSSSISISYTASTTEDVVGYRIYVTRRGGNHVLLYTGNTTDTTHTITGLSENISYNIVVVPVLPDDIVGLLANVYYVIPPSINALTHSYTYGRYGTVRDSGLFGGGGGSITSVFTTVVDAYNIYIPKTRNAITDEFDFEGNMGTLNTANAGIGYPRMYPKTYVPGRGLTFVMRSNFSPTSTYDFINFTIGSDSFSIRFTTSRMTLYSTTATQSNGTLPSGKLLRYTSQAWQSNPYNYYAYFALVIGMGSNGTTLDDQTVLLYTNLSPTSDGAVVSSSNLLTSNMAWIKLSAPITSNTEIVSPPLTGSGVIGERRSCIRMENTYVGSSTPTNITINPRHIRIYNYALTTSQVVSDYQLDVSTA